MELWLTVNGTRVNASSSLDPLTRAVVISLFTHRRADPDDNADVPMGWWGDIQPISIRERNGRDLSLYSTVLAGSNSQTIAALRSIRLWTEPRNSLIT